MKLTFEKFSKLLESLRSNPPESPDKRKQPRVGLRAHVEITMPKDPRPHLVWVRDISEGGVGLLTHAPIEEGSEFLLFLRENDGNQHLKRCTVAYCRKVASGLYTVGASFQNHSEK